MGQESRKRCGRRTLACVALALGSLAAAGTARAQTSCLCSGGIRLIELRTALAYPGGTVTIEARAARKDRLDSSPYGVDVESFNGTPFDTVTFSGAVAISRIVTVGGEAVVDFVVDASKIGKTRLDAEVDFRVTLNGDVNQVRIHVSCSQPIGPPFTFGEFDLLRFIDARGNVCTAPATCGDGVLDPEEECDDGNLSDGDCCSSSCQFEPSTTVCRPATGVCDPEERCTGSSGTCPANSFAAPGTPCGDPSDTQCTDPDTCDGAGVCQANHAASGTACGDPSNTECTDPDTCNGAGVCQANHAASGAPCGDPSNTECTDPDTCDGAGVCQANHAAAGMACGDPSNTECTDPDTCNGAGACQANHAPPGAPCGDQGVECLADDVCNGAGSCQDSGFSPPGTACGSPSDTQCTDPDACNGAGACQANHAAAGAPCGDQGVECRVNDACDGAGVCQDNGFSPPGTACGSPSDTECTDPDTCDGAGACQANHAGSGTACGDPSDTECTDPDTCNGAGACSPNHAASGAPCGDQGVECLANDTCNGAGTCQDNGFSPPGTACGSPLDTACTDPDTCNGAGACQENHAASGAPCGDQGVQCLVNDTCDGAGSCQDNGFSPSGFPCGDPSDTACTDPDTCNGAGLCQANHAPASTPCGDHSDTECTNPDSCDGAGGCRPNHEASGTLCGDPTNTECTDPDTCNGAGACSPNHAASGAPCGDQGVECLANDTCNGAGSCQDNGFSPPGAACGSASNTECTDPDTCNGVGLCQANDAPSGTACGDQGVPCHINDACDGAGACQDSGLRPDGTPCGSSADTVCDNPDTCDSAGACQPNFESSGTLCRPTAGQCDLPELCTGSSGECPADAKSTELCRPAAGICDADEFCDGVGDTCPKNFFQLPGTECRPANDLCDVTEVCTGSSAECPPDVSLPDGSHCDNNPCTNDVCRWGQCFVEFVDPGTPPPADFIVVIDTSITMMKDLRTWVPVQLGRLPDELTGAGIDWRLAIVRFATHRPSESGRGPMSPDVVLPFTTDPQIFQDAVESLQDDIRAKTESGTEAIGFTLDSLVFRDEAIRNIILYTDEDDDSPASSAERREPPRKGIDCFGSRCEIRWLPFQQRLDEVTARLIEGQVQVNLIERASNTPTREQYGDPDCTRLDGSGRLDPAATLECLLQPNRRGQTPKGSCSSTGNGGTCLTGRIGQACHTDEDCDAFGIQAALLASGECGAGAICTGGRVGSPCTRDADCAILSRAYDVPGSAAEAQSFFDSFIPDKIGEVSCPAP